MGGDKIVLLDGAGAGNSGATNGLLSMIPGMFANLMGGNKMDPNLVAALMNGRNNQDGFGGANGWWLWIIVLFWLWGGRGFGNGFGGGEGNPAINGLPAQLNNDYGRELLMQAIQGNRSAIDQIASALNCTTTQLQSAICNVQGAIDKVAGQIGMSSQAVINAVQQQGCEIGNQISSCCCNLSSLINQSTCQTQNMITQQGFDNGGRVKLNVDNIEKFGEEAVNDSDITNPSNILHYAIQDAITVSEASGNVSYKESSLLKDICDYVINNDIRRGYFYTNIALGGGSGPEYKTQFFVDYDVIYTSNNPDDLYNKVVKIYSPFNEGKNPSLAVYINEDGIINIETNNLGYRDYYLNFDPSKNDGEYNAFQINYSSLYDKSNFIFTYNDGDETGNVDQKIYYLHFNNTSTFAKNDVIFSLYNDTNKSIEVRINEVTISMAPYETITFQYLMMGSDRFIHRLYVSNVNPMN